jgi:hypothetical protein
MPNLCFWEMLIKGEQKNVEEFIKVLKTKYDYEENKFTGDRGMYSLYDIDDTSDGMCAFDDNDLYMVHVYGSCAWTCDMCMMESENSYFAIHLNDDKPRPTSLIKESKLLNLKIELFSESESDDYQEHIIVDNGEIVVNESADVDVYYVEDYDTKEDAEKDLGVDFTDEEWNEREDRDNYIYRGGFIWEFTI